jgi:hypothetical protein
VVGIINANNKDYSLRITGLAGRDLIQYKPDHAEDEEEIFVPECAEKTELRKISLLPMTRSIRSENIQKVDFVTDKDKKTLEQWRKSKDKRKWEMAVTILENRSNLWRKFPRKLNVH